MKHIFIFAITVVFNQGLIYDRCFCNLTIIRSPVLKLTFFVEGSGMKVHDLVEKLIENSTNSTGSRMLRIISICHDDHGMGKMEEKGKQKKDEKKESRIKKGKNDNDEKMIEMTDEEHIEPLKKKCKGEDISKIVDNAELPCDGDIPHSEIINPVADINDNESKNTHNNGDSMNIRWTRCLITIEKTETADTSNHIVHNISKNPRNDDKNSICLPNIFDDRGNENTSVSSKEFDDFIFPGFRKELFKATWRGGEN